MAGKKSRNHCKSASHKLFKDKAKNRVDDLQLMFTDLQYARKESRALDVSVLEEQVHQMLREWKSELHEPSPASSLQGGGNLGSDICRLLQLCEEEDDATSILASPKPEPDAQAQHFHGGKSMIFQEMPQKQGFHLVDECKNSGSGPSSFAVNNIEGPIHPDSYPLQMYQYFEQHFFSGINETYGVDGMHNINGFISNICPPLSAFLGPKCALWDCPRPAQGIDWSQEYCSGFHAALALNEGPPGMNPVVRPGGIGLKDGLLFAALSAKAQGKDVGIPECEGAATSKSPWNAPELFDIMVLEGETIREWLFFDKPRRAFESGNRKQRSLPDYNGRGWHESRKQIMNEHSGLKRSYYMDPQPLKHYEWHLYEYEISKCDASALYRLELKFVHGKKTPKGKLVTSNVTVADLQKQLGKLNAEFPSNNGNQSSLMGKRSVYTASDVTPLDPSYNYHGENINDYFLA